MLQIIHGFKIGILSKCQPGDLDILVWLTEALKGGDEAVTQG